MFNLLLNLPVLMFYHEFFPVYNKKYKITTQYIQDRILITVFYLNLIFRPKGLYQNMTLGGINNQFVFSKTKQQFSLLLFFLDLSFSMSYNAIGSVYNE